MGIAIVKDGFATAGDVTIAVVNAMIANGFKAIFPVDTGGVFLPPVDAGKNKFKVVLEATGDVDPLNKTDVPVKQPWRIAFQVTDNATMGMFAGTPTSLPDNGVLPFTSSLIVESSTTTTKIVGARGIVGENYTPYRTTSSADKPYFTNADLFQPHWNNPTEGFINRRTKVWVDAVSKSSSGSSESPPNYPTDPLKDISASYPMSFYLAITPRGFFLSIWQGANTNMNGTDFSWVLVQRPVKRDTGLVVTDGKAPVFCVSSVGNSLHRFVVRESDVVDASAIIAADVDSLDGTAIINSKKQIGVSENNQYIINYPSRLNTPRYAYTYELDMIGYASATVVSASTEVPQTLYSEPTERKYIGMHSNVAGNNGMRIVALKSGGGIDA